MTSDDVVWLLVVGMAVAVVIVGLILAVDWLTERYGKGRKP